MAKNTKDYLEEYINKKDFEYDVFKDPIYLALKKSYEDNAKRTAEDLLGKYSQISGGGSVSSAAMSAASGAAAAEMSKLSGHIPELYELARQMYDDELAANQKKFQAMLDDKHYYDFLSDMTGVNIDGEYSLIQMIRNMATMRSEYESVENALRSVRQTGYGVVAPQRDEVELSEPEIIRQGNKFGVKINAKAPSIHLIQADIQMEISPIVGSEEQAKDLVDFIKHNSEDPEVGIWNTNIFGKSIEQIVEDGIQSKMNIMTETSRSKLQETIYKVINDGNGGLVCIII